MHKLFVIARREYLERVRTKTFLLSTIALPLLMIALTTLPARFAMKAMGNVHVAVVSADAALAQEVKQQLLGGRPAGEDAAQPANEEPGRAAFQVDLESDTSDAHRNELRAKVAAGQLDGYVWLPATVASSREVTYVTRDNVDAMDTRPVRDAVSAALLRRELMSAVPRETVERLTSPMKIQTLVVKGASDVKTNPTLLFTSTIGLVMILYVTLLLYGVAIMRSVIEEKSTRMIEMLLASSTPRQILGGKLLGVGAVGLTQVAIWVLMAGVVMGAGAGAAAASGVSLAIRLSPTLLAAFVVCFVAGYALYSTSFAALGAAVNTEREAQQWQMFLIAPLVIPILMLVYLVRNPDAPVSVALSLIPFFSPISMYARFVAQTPPGWQVALSLALMLASIWLVFECCQRIYRVGVLMYGKRPTLPELIRWLRLT